jgi:uncharacterized protein YciI
MPFAIRTTDKPGMQELRNRLQADHLKYLDSQLGILLAAGSLRSDDNQTAIGGILIVDVEDRAAAERFINDDPFARNGLFAEIRIDRWRKAYLDKKRFI